MAHRVAVGTTGRNTGKPGARGGGIFVPYGVAPKPRGVGADGGLLPEECAGENVLITPEGTSTPGCVCPRPPSTQGGQSVFRFYGSLVADVYSTRTTSKLKDVCIHSFLLPEALQALASEYADRGNFHTTIGHWLSLAGRAGWTYIAHRDATITRQGLISTTILFGR